MTALLSRHLHQLHLSAFSENLTSHVALATAEGWTFDRFLASLCELEVRHREARRIANLLAASRLPRAKTLAAFDRARLPVSVERQFASLVDGQFLARRENVLAFGNPGSGKTHLLCALGIELVNRGFPVLFTPCVLLVQRLLTAKAGLSLEREFRRLDKFDALIIDDLGYVQQSREEMEVLFSLLAHRYEHRSVLLTSNLAFSAWEKIFKDPMTTAAAIDRLVHHAVILELNLPSFRAEAAGKRKKRE